MSGEERRRLAAVLAIAEEELRSDLADLLKEAGHDVRSLPSGESRFSDRVDLVFCDPGGLQAWDASPVGEEAGAPGVPVVLVVRRPTVEMAITALRRGCRDVVEYPDGVRKLFEILSDAERESEARDRAARFREEMEGARGLSALLGDSPPMQAVRRLIEKIVRAKGVTTVLVRGETGTGKELVAEAIHYESRHRTGAFMAVNCAALPESLLEAELFGHEKGAFTDARTSRGGLVEAADGGTLFLDEIGEMSPALQAKLLRMIDQKATRRVGGVETRPVDVRIVAATHRDLAEEIRRGRFRADLYYRLNVVTVELPPLRERGDDLPVLARHFLRRYAAEHEREIAGFTPEALQRIKTYTWPGNVRELRNVVERIVLLQESRWVDVDDLPPAVRGADRLRVPDEGPRLSISLPIGEATIDRVERELVDRMLDHTQWNKSRAAVALGISRPRLLRLIQKHRLRP